MLVGDLPQYGGSSSVVRHLTKRRRFRDLPLALCSLTGFGSQMQLHLHLFADHDQHISPGQVSHAIPAVAPTRP